MHESVSIKLIFLELTYSFCVWKIAYVNRLKFPFPLTIKSYIARFSQNENNIELLEQEINKHRHCLFLMYVPWTQYR